MLSSGWHGSSQSYALVFVKKPQGNICLLILAFLLKFPSEIILYFYILYWSFIHCVALASCHNYL